MRAASMRAAAMSPTVVLRSSLPAKTCKCILAMVIDLIENMVVVSCV